MKGEHNFFYNKQKEINKRREELQDMKGTQSLI